MYLKSIDLKEQFADVLNDLEGCIKQVLECLYLDKKLTEKELQEKVTFLIRQYNQKQSEFEDLLKRVNAHQEREAFIRTLEDVVESRENLISRIASELNTMENALVEATFQAGKKLKSVKQSEVNRVFSEDVIRFAHLISKHHSVASSVYWQQGDPTRPYPIDANFAVSKLNQLQHQQMNASQMKTSAAPIFNMPGMPQQRAFTPNARTSSATNLFHSGLGTLQTGSGSTGSPRGRPPANTNVRLSSPSPRSFPKILQRSGSQQSPRFSMMFGAGQGSNGGGGGSFALASPSTLASIQAAQQQLSGGQSMMPATSGANIMMGVQQQQHLQQQQPTQMMVNLPFGLKQQQTANLTNATTMQIPKVEQMSSDSSSSSSSGDEEASPDAR